MPVATNAQLIGGLYAAVFNRAPDPAGLTFWENAFTGTSTIYDLAQGFAAHPVFASTYGGMSNAQFVASIYQKVLGAEGDTNGLAYWTAKADSGISRADIVAEFVNDSLTVDLSLFTDLTPAELAVAQNRQDALTNKVDVGLTFAAQFGADANLNPATDTTTQAGLESDPAYLAAQAAIANVTASPASVTTAKANIATAVASPNPTGTLIGITPPVVVDPGTPTTPTTFIATVDPLDNFVSFTGTATGDITVAWSGTPGASIATFTRDGKTVTADFAGNASSIALAADQVLKASAAQLAGVGVSGTTGTVKLTGSSLTATELASLNTNINPSLDVALVTTLTGDLADVKTAVTAAGIVNLAANVGVADVSGNLPITDLSAIALKTTGTVSVTGDGTGTGPTALNVTGLLADLTSELLAVGSRVDVGAADIDITDLNGDVAATVLSQLSLKTDNEVWVLNGMNVTGSVDEVTAALVASNKVVLDPDFLPTVTLSGLTADAGALNLIDTKTPGVLIATSFTEVSGSVADLLTYTSKPSGEIQHAANYAIVSTDNTITAAQLGTLDDANSTGSVSTSALNGWSITGLSGSIVATASVDNFVFSAADVGVTITDFSANDKIDVSLVSSASSFTVVAGPQTTNANQIYFLTGASNDADTKQASADALNLAGPWTDANATTYIVISDDDSSAIYKFTDTADSPDGVDVTELTLLGTVDSVLTSGNFTFSAS